MSLRRYRIRDGLEKLCPTEAQRARDFALALSTRRKKGHQSNIMIAQLRTEILIPIRRLHYENYTLAVRSTFSTRAVASDCPRNADN